MSVTTQYTDRRVTNRDNAGRLYIYRHTGLLLRRVSSSSDACGSTITSLRTAVCSIYRMYVIVGGVMVSSSIILSTPHHHRHHHSNPLFLVSWIVVVLLRFFLMDKRACAACYGKQVHP